MSVCLCFSNPEAPCFLFAAFVLAYTFIFTALDPFLATSYMHSYTPDFADQVLYKYLFHEWIFLDKSLYMMISLYMIVSKVPWASFTFYQTNSLKYSGHPCTLAQVSLSKWRTLRLSKTQSQDVIIKMCI